MVDALKEWIIERGFNFQNYEILIDIIEKEPEDLYMLFLKSKMSSLNSEEISTAKKISSELISYYFSLKRDNKLKYLLEYSKFRISHYVL